LRSEARQSALLLASCFAVSGFAVFLDRLLTAVS